MKISARRTGRPIRPAVPGARVSLGLKVTPDIKTKLDAATRITGRTQSHEAEVRLESTFVKDDAFGGASARQVAMLMGAAFTLAGSRKGQEMRVKDWANDGDCFFAGMQSVLGELMTHAPRPLTKLEGLALEGIIRTYYANQGGNDDAR